MKSYKRGEIIPKIVEIFQDHIGNENQISRNALFKKLFDVDYNKKKYKHYMLWNTVRSRFSDLRKKSLCFIQSDRPVGGNESGNYFVPKRFAESAFYSKELSKSVKARVNTIKTVNDSVANKDYRKEWFE